MTGVGLVGCGRIALEAHADAYALAGVEVGAVCDLDPVKAAALADRLGCAVARDPATLAARSDVDIIDVATPPHDRGELLRSLFTHGKPILAQKPLTYDVETAAALADEAAAARVPLAVNHNARWAPNHLAVYRRLLAGDLGHVYALAHHNRFSENVDTWYTRHPSYLFLDHGIHYFDLVRVLTGRTPAEVSTTAGRFPGQLPAGPIVHSTQVRFTDPDAPHVMLSFVNAVPAPDGFDYRLIIDGTKASLQASLFTVSVLPHQPRADDQVVGGHDLPVSGNWVPDGFAGALRSFIGHLERGEALLHSAADHVASLAFADAAARSAHNHGAWTPLDVPSMPSMKNADAGDGPEVADGFAHLHGYLR